VKFRSTLNFRRGPGGDGGPRGGLSELCGFEGQEGHCADYAGSLQPPLPSAIRLHFRRFRRMRLLATDTTARTSSGKSLEALLPSRGPEVGRRVCKCLRPADFCAVARRMAFIYLRRSRNTRSDLLVESYRRADAPLPDGGKRRCCEAGVPVVGQAPSPRPGRHPPGLPAGQGRLPRSLRPMSASAPRNKWGRPPRRASGAGGGGLTDPTS
jgi:hypothetical protein